MPHETRTLPRVFYRSPYYGHAREILTDLSTERELALALLHGLELPSHTSTSGPLYVSHVGIIGQHRDSDALSRVNYSAVLADLSERFGDTVSVHDDDRRECSGDDDSGCLCTPDVSDVRFRDAMVGWTETVCVRPFYRDASGVWTITDAARASREWSESLTVDACADEHALAELELTELSEYLADSERIPTRYVSRFVSELSGDGYSADYLEHSALESIARDILAELSESIRTYDRLRALGNGQMTLTGETVTVPSAPELDECSDAYETAERILGYSETESSETAETVADYLTRNGREL